MNAVLAFVCVVGLFVGMARAQVSGFVSASTGYHANPLYNYERASDQIKQTYLELKYSPDADAQTMTFSYVSGLMLFNRFTDRNYYEHNVQARYSVRLGSTHRDDPIESADSIEAETEPENNEQETTTDDSVSSFLDLGMKVGARHDKTAFKEFDNVGIALAGSIRFPISDEFFVRVSNTVDYRRYVYLAELSNITNTLAMQLGSNPAYAFNSGIRTVVGLKHFTSSLYDTARFETKRTYILKPAGKGKPGAKIKVPSTKQLLINSESDNILQLSAGVYAMSKWSDGSVGLELMYRRNPGSPSRYLAQYANTSILNEDIYNDHFSYEGPNVQLRIAQSLPLGLQSIVTVEYQRKQFGAPAVDLVGEQTADHRIDLRSSAEVYLSRYISLTENVGLDLALGAELLRNESNDSYNDYSLFQISGSIGIGF